jgi:predicted RNA-binding Zn-ribbon protein involved in translation (DUF1610 family)
MAKERDLIKFLFGESVELESAEADSLELAENLERLFEAIDKASPGELKPKKTPLAKALAELGITDSESDLELDTEGFVLATDNHQRYVDALTVLGSADAMHKLAEMGWVVTRPGDNAMTNEPANYRIRFLEIATTEENDREPKGGTYDTANREEVIKKAQEFATTPMDRDDEMNPVETDIKGSDQDRKGVGKEKDGAQPEGTPKGTSGKPKLNNVQDSLQEEEAEKAKYRCPKCKTEHKKVNMPDKNPEAPYSCYQCGYEGKPQKVSESELQEFTSTGSMGTSISQHQPFIGPGLRTKGKGGSLGGKFKMPGQWTVKQPVVKQQIKRKVRSESAEGTAESFLKEEGPSDIPPGTFGNPGGEGEPSSEADEQEAYQDMQNELQSGECVVFDDSRSGPTRVMVNGKLFGTINGEEHAQHSQPFQKAPQGVFRDVTHALRAVNAEMEREGFFPNIYHVNDHGNVSLWDKNGKELKAWV